MEKTNVKSHEDLPNPGHLDLSMQVQRVQSFCVLFEGILARQRELHVRAAEVVAEQAAMDTPILPRKGGQGALDSTEDRDVSVVGGAEAVGGGFAPSLGEIDQTFVFAMIWGLGGGLTGDPALAFDVYVRDLVQVSGNRCAQDNIRQMLEMYRFDIPCVWPADGRF